MTQEALKLALEALEDALNKPMWDRPKMTEAITAIKEALREHAMREVQRLGQEIEQEPVEWGVDWGKAGDIPCVSIIKRLSDGGIKVLAVEYAPYSYTTPPQRTWVGLEWNDMVDVLNEANGKSMELWEMFKALEAKIKERNT
jgi:hypothetical protein